MEPIEDGTSPMIEELPVDTKPNVFVEGNHTPEPGHTLIEGGNHISSTTGAKSNGEHFPDEV